MHRYIILNFSERIGEGQCSEHNSEIFTECKRISGHSLHVNLQELQWWRNTHLFVHQCLTRLICMYVISGFGGYRKTSEKCWYPNSDSKWPFTGYCWWADPPSGCFPSSWWCSTSGCPGNFRYNHSKCLCYQHQFLWECYYNSLVILDRSCASSPSFAFWTNHAWLLLQDNGHKCPVLVFRFFSRKGGINWLCCDGNR